jgi:hypothetical protein
LVAVLNRYLAAGAEAVLAQEGTVDKFLGDAVMAWFNAPLPQPDHTLRAVRAALALEEAIKVLHAELPPEAHLSFGIGIHYGEAFKQWKPIRDRPKVVEVSERFFKTYGFLGIFIGRFFGPLHGTIATVAAIAKMNPLVFHLSNWASAAVWAAAILGGGSQSGELLRRIVG